MTPSTSRRVAEVKMELAHHEMSKPKSRIDGSLRWEIVKGPRRGSRGEALIGKSTWFGESHEDGTHRSHTAPETRMSSECAHQTRLRIHWNVLMKTSLGRFESWRSFCQMVMSNYIHLIGLRRDGRFHPRLRAVAIIKADCLRLN